MPYSRLVLPSHLKVLEKAGLELTWPHAAVYLYVCFYNFPSPWRVSRKRCHVLQHSEGAACLPVSAVRLLRAPSLPVALMSS